MSGRILVVDDVWDMRDLLRELLASEGYEVVATETGRAAVHVIDEDKTIKLALLDVNLPDYSGVDLMNALRHRQPDLKVIFITGNRKKEDVIKALKSGANDYLVKPIEPAQVLQKVKVQLGGAASDRGYAVAKVNMPVTVLGMPFELILTCVELSEVGCRVLSAMPFKVGALFDMQMTDIQTGKGQALPVNGRVRSCEQLADKSRLDIEFLGLPDELATKIRALTIRSIPVKAS